MITKTIGTGGDYPTILDAWISLCPIYPGPALTDNYTFNIISDFTEKSIFNFQNDYRVKLAGKSLSFVNTGNYRITVPNLVRYIFTSADGGGGTISLDGLNFNLPFNYGGFSLISFAGEGSVVYNVNYKNLSILGAGFNVGNTSIGIYLAEGGWAPQIQKLYNCKIAGIGKAIVGGVASSSVSATQTIENVSIYGCSYGVQIDQASAGALRVFLKNVVSANTANNDFTVNINSDKVSITNCVDEDNSIASSGAVLSGNITGITAADFLSVDPTSSDFLKLNQDFNIATPPSPVIGETVNLSSSITCTSLLWETGTTPSIPENTEDLAGNQRPNDDGNTSIGVYEKSEIISYLWDLDDGKVSSDPNPSVVYTLPGTKNISLTLVLADSSTVILTGTVEVTVYTLDFYGDNLSGVAPLETKFAATFEL